ncbi:hypothetical protein PIIN_04106 [Serendipita indica DSM 11827]|uniref:Uncharacterized protein n=1 Tax=Serendipita indica (strain DSM 11827) TaxID=1109443 RepID=G4TFR8_SERID|nr:hypothetical protein PIIN_04106 [Serendipita indica DSM 11827]
MQTTITSVEGSVGTVQTIVNTVVDVRVLSPSLSQWAGAHSTNDDSNDDNESTFSINTDTSNAQAGFATVLDQRMVSRATFDVHDWRWNNDIPGAVPEDGGPTPRVRTLSLVQGILRPIPQSVPETLPSLYAPSSGANGEEDEDDRTEADSIWAHALNCDNLIATTASQQNLFPGVPDDAPLIHNPPEAFEDFPDLEIIIASLRAWDTEGGDNTPVNQQN